MLHKFKYTHIKGDLPVAQIRTSVESQENHEDVFAIQDYIKGNPNKSDLEIAEKFKCNVLLVQESRKRT